MIIKKDAIEMVKSIDDNYVDLIYTDPPFGTGKLFSSKSGSYIDPKIEEMKNYLKEFISESKRIISKNGLIAFHVDHRLSHWIRVFCDETFGENKFVNEIIWSYKTGGSTSKRFSRKHDSIIVYSKSSKHTFNPTKEKSYNRGFKPYRFKGVKEYQDEKGRWYTLVNMKDVWSDIPALGRTSGERVDYPTQKPLDLSNRIISAFTNERDVVMDPFMGSGTHILSARNLNRSYIGSDMNEESIKILKKRLL